MDADRRRRFIAHFAGSAFKGDRAKLIQKTKLTKGRVAQLFDENQAFGERAARALAVRLNLPPAFFEQDFGAVQNPLGDLADDFMHSDTSGDAYSAMLTAFARQMASLPRSARVGIAAMLVDIDDPAKAVEVASQVHRLARADVPPENQAMQIVPSMRKPVDDRPQGSRLIGKTRRSTPPPPDQSIKK